MPNEMITVYVDEDACPVKDEIEVICKRWNTFVVFVASYAHMIGSPYAKVVMG